MIQTPEVLRVYISSFWDHPIDESHESYKLFEQERTDLLADLMSLPRNSAVRKINELVKRARLAKTHAFIMAHLRSEMPTFFGKSKKQQQLLDDLPAEFSRVATKFKVAPGDFPNISRFRKTLADFDLSKFPAKNTKLITKIDQVLSHEIPALMKSMRIVHVEDEVKSSIVNPFSSGVVGDVGVSNWAVTSGDKQNYDNIFYNAKLINNKLSGNAAKELLLGYATHLTNTDLFKVWGLADIDSDGALDNDEFAVAMYVIEKTKSGDLKGVPDILPPNLIPPSKKTS